MTTESFRKDVAKKLSELQASSDEDAKIDFPTDLTSSDRKYIHKIAESFRLHTLSSGTGDARFISVYKNPPAGQEAKRPREPAGATPQLSLSAAAAQSLQQIAASAQTTGGRTLLAKVKTLGRSRMTPAAKPAAVPNEGDVVEAFWPDDETWLEATVTQVSEDGSFRIVWAMDDSESDVPADYVRWPGGEQMEGEDVTLEFSGVDMSVEVMEAALEERRALPKYSELATKREALPAFKQREQVITAVKENQVVLLSGETGCGKSTQVPQLILDAAPEAKILVMQPRRIAATTLAERIAVERCQRLGVDVGYQVPSASQSERARLVFCTLGVFRRRLLLDPDLVGVTHIIFDEVHERDKLADFNMIVVRDLLARRSDLRLVLMSATLQMDTFERYFEGATKVKIPGRVYPVSELYLDEVAATLYKQGQKMFQLWLGPGILCGGIDIPAGAEGDWNERAWKTVVFKHTKPEDRDSLWGLREKGLESQMLANMSRARLLDGLRKHDVLQQSGLAFDYPIIEALILHIDRMYKDAQKDQTEEKPAGTILVFLPGWGDIDTLQKRLAQNFDPKRFKILPLHSQVTPQQQQEIFEPAPAGVRKIVLTTNIAEASITVEGTEFVIDSARAKEVSYDPYLKVGTLTTSWISKASAKQRAGRAGRTQGGLCFHLFCRERYNKVDDFLPPELLRSPLEDSALTAKLMLLQMGSNEKVSDFLLKAPDPPEKLAIDNSIQLLVELGALTKGEQLTALGEHLTKSPLPPRLAKTVLWAILLGCLDDALCVVAAAGGFFREPWKTAGMDREEAQQLKRDLAKPHNSDHGCLLNAVTGYTDANNQQSFCDKWQLNQATMRLIRDQQNRLYTECQENKTDSFANRNRGNFQLLTAVLCAGIFPNIARRRGGSDFYEAQNGKVEARLHGSSAYMPEKPDEWVFFQELSQMESTYRLKLVSPVTPMQMLLLGGQGPLQKENNSGKGNGKGGITVSMLEGWVKFRCDDATADQVQKVRNSLQAAFQSFCASPDQIPNAATLQMLDQAVPLLSDASTGGGVKRAASWPAEDRGGPVQRTYPGKGSWKGNGFKGGWKGGKGKGKW